MKDTDQFYSLQVTENELPAGKAEAMKLCARPRFQIWKNGVMHKEIDGVLIDEIDKTVQSLLPSIEDAWKGKLVDLDNLTKQDNIFNVYQIFQIL